MRSAILICGGCGGGSCGCIVFFDIFVYGIDNIICLSEPSQKSRIIRRYVHLLRILNGRLHFLEAVVQLFRQVELLVLGEPTDLVVGGRLVQGEHIPSDGERLVLFRVHSRFVLLRNYFLL